jgi:CRISPR system Cascade subunit CasA
MNNNLLTDPLFGIKDMTGNHQRLSLPGLLAALGTSDVMALTGVQRHQANAFHIFLCCLAAHVLEVSRASELAQDEDFWRTGLRQLSGGDLDDAWQLRVEDLTQPAFMQPPVSSEKSAAEFKPNAETPDKLDVLQTAKNHDLKAARIRGSSAEDWALALISLQTMSGYLGKGKYGIVRMYGGYGSRPVVATYTDLSPGGRWREDINRLMDLRSERLVSPWPFQATGHRLLWVLPWDGKTGLGLESLHPFFIEICQLIRLDVRNGSVIALGQRSTVPRITVSKETAGNVGDPWIPIRRSKGTALTVSGRGFDPGLLRDLIISQSDWQPAVMQQMAPGPTPAWFHASVLVRGQGTTDGFHEIYIRIAPRAKASLLGGGSARERLGQLSDWALDRAHGIRNRALRPALFALLEGGPEGWPDTGRREVAQWVDSWLSRYDHGWSDEYFPWLWATVDRDDDTARAQWLEPLRDLAEGVLEEAIQTAPQRNGRHYRGRIRAAGLFRGAFYKHFGQEMPDVRK